MQAVRKNLETAVQDLQHEKVRVDGALKRLKRALRVLEPVTRKKPGPKPGKKKARKKANNRSSAWTPAMRKAASRKTKKYHAMKKKQRRK